MLMPMLGIAILVEILTGLMNLGGEWYQMKKNGALNWAGYSPIIENPSDYLKVSASLAFSNLTPAAGETLTEAFSIKNTLNGPITVNVGLADLNLNNGWWDSFTPQSNVTFAAGETKYFSFNRLVKFPGQHKSWISLQNGAVWYDAQSLTSQLLEFTYPVHLPNLNVEVFWFNNLPPVLNNQVQATVTIKNLEPKPIYVDSVGVPNINLITGAWKTFNSNTSSLTFAAGESKTMLFTNTLTETGFYRAWPAINLSGVWYSGVKNGTLIWVGYTPLIY